MGITNSNKELSAARIDCGGSFQVRLSLTAEPDITTNPTDIVLILDRSGSMAGSALANLKNGAKAFIDIIDEATDGSQDGQIGSGSRIAVVSFANTATQDTQLITSVADLKAAVDALTADGSTNHGDAFAQASQLLAAPSTNARVMVMFTDGQTTTGPNPSPIAAAARAAGVTIYAIGLSGSDGVDAAALEDWASKPASAYVAITPDDAELEELFEDLARNIVNPGATNVVVTDTVSPCFRITSVSMPSKGTASLLDANNVQWQIDELGVAQSEGAVLEFTVQHIGPCSGTVEVNEAVSYDDAEGNVVSFPSPELEVDCDIVVLPEICPEPVALTIDGCEDALEFDAGSLGLESLGRIVQLSVTLQDVCPNRRVALAAILTEVDEAGVEYQRGMKTVLIPAHTRDTCQDVSVRCMKFVLPESLSVSGEEGTICSARNFRARFIANYVDNGFACCSEVL
ncbi:MAG: VWA domain-containing protein [Oscillibacter sp.]|nr:VWA domain-containing protein [Oscillibacter sp.]